MAAAVSLLHVSLQRSWSRPFTLGDMSRTQVVMEAEMGQVKLVLFVLSFLKETDISRKLCAWSV